MVVELILVAVILNQFLRIRLRKNHNEFIKPLIHQFIELNCDIEAQVDKFTIVDSLTSKFAVWCKRVTENLDVLGANRIYEHHPELGRYMCEYGIRIAESRNSLLKKSFQEESFVNAMKLRQRIFDLLPKELTSEAKFHLTDYTPLAHKLRSHEW